MTPPDVCEQPTASFDSAYLIERYAQMCDLADRHADDGWRSAGEDGMKRRFALSPQVLDRFADYLFGGIGFEMQRDFLGAMPSLDGTIAARPELDDEQRLKLAKLAFNELVQARQHFVEAGIPEEEWTTLVAADNVVGGQLVLTAVKGRRMFVSRHTIEVAKRATTVRSALGGLPASVLEIGGGHGRFVRDVLKLAPSTRITYSDLPLNLLLAARYLSRVFPGKVHLAWDDAPIPDTAQITLVVPWRLRDLPYPVDLCCNFLSFQHMQADNLAFYGEALRALGVPLIYHVNRRTALHPHEIPIDAYPLRRNYRSRSIRFVSTAQQWRTANGVSTLNGQVEIVEEILDLAAPAGTGPA